MATYKVEASQIREFEEQIKRFGGIDYAALCINCLPVSERREVLSKLERSGQTTRGISKSWRESK